MLQDMEESVSRKCLRSYIGDRFTSSKIEPVRNRTQPLHARRARLLRVSPTRASRVALAQPLVNGYAEGCQMWKLSPPTLWA
ncbi:hypothetical protein ACO22_07989 [Paracoccidioides brasiliensis]|uniref:Uncharacterized protein n=1 Tax=Paracoccidioides brasiliensis TaxID=121759 RepID=A0A1D2J360_PARBR|nr:hypothetical protein ACO22_07989 [Paracoccidioides brasiliensis]